MRRDNNEKGVRVSWIPDVLFKSIGVLNTHDFCYEETWRMYIRQLTGRQYVCKKCGSYLLLICTGHKLNRFSIFDNHEDIFLEYYFNKDKSLSNTKFKPPTCEEIIMQKVLQ